jgi:hypothetical protein
LEKFEKLEIKDTRDIGKIEGIGKLCREWIFSFQKEYLLKEKI